MRAVSSDSGRQGRGRRPGHTGAATAGATLFPRLRSVLTTLAQGKHFVQSLDEEVRFHLDAQTDDLVRAGFSPAEAARRARELFGSVEAVKNECQRERGVRFIDELGPGARQVGLLLRRLFKTPVATMRGAYFGGSGTASAWGRSTAISTLYFSGAKQAGTRASRVEKYVPRILEGKGLRDR